MKFENTQNISSIEYEQTVYPYCPLGLENYVGTLIVNMVPGDLIPDYCDETKFINTFNQSQYIIEDVINIYFNHLVDEYHPKELSVTMQATTSGHFPVTVTKTM